MHQNKRDKIHVKQVRKIGTTRRSVSGVYVFRGESAVQFESTLERDFIIRKEFNLSVLDIIPQPCEITFKDCNGHSRIYTPDFLVYYRLGSVDYEIYPKPELIEVKPQKHWKKNWRKWLPKWKAAYRYAKTQGWAFHIYDETRIRDKSLENIRFLERYSRMHFLEEDSTNILEYVEQMGIATISDILARSFMGIYRHEGLSYVWNLIATRKLDCDPGRPLNELTEVWVPTYE